MESCERRPNSFEGPSLKSDGEAGCCREMSCSCGSEDIYLVCNESDDYNNEGW
jgi:hypothetical protein